jgi:ATP-dependent DNA ligase
LQRIHPAPSRIQRLSRETPAKLLVFDLLENGSQVFTGAPLRLRREVLSNWTRANLHGNPLVQLSPASTDPADAQRWLHDLAAMGCDGVIAKQLSEPYHSGDRKAMQKIKRIRSADCVVGGFRYASKGDREAVASLLLGLYNDQGKLDHVGFTSSFSAEERRRLKEKLAPAMPTPGKEEEEQAGFSGASPGGPSRWNAGDPSASEWIPLLPKLVVEVSYDHFSGSRFRHGTKLLHWRPDKSPRQCTKDQIEAIKTEAEPADSNSSRQR